MIYTVIGLINDDTGALTVAGVVEGEHSMVDLDPGDPYFSRYATSVEADSPEEAERLAKDEAEENNG